MLKTQLSCFTPGGQMVLQMAGVNDKGESGGHTHFIKTRFYTTLNRIFRDMCDEGLITEVDSMEAIFIYLNL